MSKGSGARPFSVEPEVFSDRHALAFGPPKVKPRYVPPPLPENFHAPDAVTPVADKKAVQPAHPVAETGAAQRD